MTVRAHLLAIKASGQVVRPDVIEQARTGWRGRQIQTEGRLGPPIPMRALIFDLDGTLIDTVYAHVFAWQRALTESGLAIDGWKIHRRIGMSGGLFTRAVAREIGKPLSDNDAGRIQALHGELVRDLLPEQRPLPRAGALLSCLLREKSPHRITRFARYPEGYTSLAAP